MTAPTPARKVAALWLPIGTFVALGLEHSVANAFLLPVGAMCGAPVSAADIVVHNIVPVTIGNFFGAMLVVALARPAAAAAASAALKAAAKATR